MELPLVATSGVDVNEWGEAPFPGVVGTATIYAGL